LVLIFVLLPWINGFEVVGASDSAGFPYYFILKTKYLCGSRLEAPKINIMATC
jgi:hypothetical protein